MNAPINNTSEITAALSHIPAQDRDTWLSMGMAVKSELFEDGFTLWDSWSQNASNYCPKAAKSTWRSIKSSGGVTIATLFHEAANHGWKPSTTHATPTPEQFAKIAAERAEAEKEAARIEAEQHAIASAKAAKLIAKATPVSASHPYILTKGIRPYGAYQLRESLLIPVTRESRLLSLQVISNKGKVFLTGGETKGGYLLIGVIKDAPKVLMCEGWATGCSLHEATGIPVVVCFSAHNLVTVAKRLAQVFAGDVLVCGDNDHSTDGNPGKTAALKAASQIVNARVILPTFNHEQIEQHYQRHKKQPTDFNDLHKLAGLAEVRTMIMNTMANSATKDTDEIPDLSKNVGDTGDAGDSASNPNNGAASSDLELYPNLPDTAGDAGDNAEIPRGYMLKHVGKEPGLHWESKNDKGDTVWNWVCSPLFVLARTRDAHGRSWGRLLVWYDPEGRRHQWAMPAAMTVGDGSEMTKALVDGGLDVCPTLKGRSKLVAYIVGAKGQGFVRCTNRTGWHGDAFVLPDEVIAPPGAEKVFLQADRDDSLGMSQAGTTDEWRENVSVLASGNSRLLFAISLGFAAPLAELAGESGGVHFVGPSSIGKTTIQLAAGSVWGNPQSYKIMWRATANGLEGVCFARNDLLLVLDDIGECDGRAAGEAAYMMANGQGKARSGRDGSARATKSWRVLFLSSGEVGLSQHMAEAGKQIRAGQEVRMVDLPARASGDFGVFDVLTGGEVTGAALSERIRALTSKYHGTAGRAFLHKVAGQRGKLSEVLKDYRDKFIQETITGTPEGQVMRTVGRFALIATAGELATAWGFTGWKQGEAWEASKKLFGEWLAARGGKSNTEPARMVAAVRAFLELHGESRFSLWGEEADTHSKTINRAGFRKIEDGEVWYYILGETYRREVCKGFDPAQVSEALYARGMLKVQSSEITNGKVRRYDTQARLPEVKKVRCFVITPAIWEDEQEATL